MSVSSAWRDEHRQHSSALSGRDDCILDRALFMDFYDPATTFSAIDEMGRLRLWQSNRRSRNGDLARFAETLLPLLDPQP